MDSVDENSVMEPLDSSVAVEGMRLLEEREMNVFRQLTRHGRKFFLKGINSRFADVSMARSLLHKEYDLGMRMDHSGIVRFLSLEMVPGAGECILMEWIDGIKLSEWMRGEPTVKKRMKMAGEIIDIVSYMARKGVAHRDLKPDNIMVRSVDESPCLIDFGHGDSEDFITHKLAAGTATFGAPEQHEHRQSGLAADVYALGRILEFLRLSRTYRPLIKSCLRDNPSLRPKAGDVRARFNRCVRLRRYPVVILIVALSAAIAAWALWRNLPDNSAAEQSREVPTSGADAKVYVTPVDATDADAAVELPQAKAKLPETTPEPKMSEEGQKKQRAISEWEAVTGQKIVIPPGYTAEKAYDKALKEVKQLFKAYDERLGELRIEKNNPQSREEFYKKLQTVTGEIGEAYGKIQVNLSAELYTMGVAQEATTGYLKRLYDYYITELEQGLDLEP
ncbi:MAG: protein kinase [Bacteroidales bacterium]|nr:protein kinase [Bacteroidales bacterium]